MDEGDLTALLRQHASRHSVPGAAIGILREGAATTAYFGVADVSVGEPVTPETLFSVGSLTKSMVATVIARLAGAGRLALDDPVAAHVPELRGSGWAQGATLRDLLANRSGLALRTPLAPEGSGLRWRSRFVQPAPARCGAGRDGTIDAMSDHSVAVAPIVRRKAEALGDLGEAWLAGLPDLIADLERHWSVHVEQPLDGGTAAYVARARTQDGRDVVLKLGLPDPQFADEVGTIARARGRGYVQLLAHDAGRHAMLLEALGPSMTKLDMAPEAQLETLCHLLRQAWTVPRPVTGRYASAVDKASGLNQFLGKFATDPDRPCSEQVLAQALLFAGRRAAAFDQDHCVVIHGDAAAANALQVLVPREGAETGFVFVDPDGFIGDPAYDLGVALRDWCPQLLASNDPLSLARRYCRLLAEGSGVDEQAIWEWGYLERVTTGLYVWSLGGSDQDRPHLDTAELLV